MVMLQGRRVQEPTRQIRKQRQISRHNTIKENNKTKELEKYTKKMRKK
jgi:hypothetical protein